jgi:TolB-like protein
MSFSWVVLAFMPAVTQGSGEAVAPSGAASAPTVVEVPAAAEPAPAAPASSSEVRGVDARMRVLADGVALDLKRIPGDHRVQRFAVTRLEEIGEQSKERQLGLVLSDMVVTDLARQHNLPLVERAALAKVMDEQALGQTGALDEKQAAQIGKVSGARGLVIGSVADAPEGFRVTLRAVDTESGAVLSTHEATLPGEELVAYASGAVVLRSRSGAMFRSIVAPGWGQLYNDEPVKAAALGGLTGVLALTTVGALGVGVYMNYVRYPNLGPDDAKGGDEDIGSLLQSTRDTGNAAFTLGGVLAGATVVAWAATVMDAWLSGHDVESADAALATR